MAAFLLGSSLLLLALWVGSATEVAWALRRTRVLRDLPAELEGTWPSVTFVIPARDEAEHIERAKQSVLAIDYPSIQVIAVDDRSSDGTGAILDRLAEADPRLRVLHVSTLPEGWLGKPHAIWRGADEAESELLVFVDADVVLERDALRRAVAHLERQGLDFLTAAPDLSSRTWAGRVFFTCISLMFFQFWKPWQVRNPKRKRGLGIGAFMLIRREAYERVGTYRAVATEAVDDVRFGQAVKSAGLRAEVVAGAGAVHVEWYPSLAATVRGLTKNAFAANRYSVALTLAASLFLLAFHVWPWIGWPLVEGPARWSLLGCVGLSVLGFIDFARFLRTHPLQALAMPFAALTVVYCALRSMAVTLVRGGVTWRGTHYDLATLRGEGR